MARVTKMEAAIPSDPQSAGGAKSSPASPGIDDRALVRQAQKGDKAVGGVRHQSSFKARGSHFIWGRMKLSEQHRWGSESSVKCFVGNLYKFLRTVSKIPKGCGTGDFWGARNLKRCQDNPIRAA